jgi:hypothetical protein
LLAAAAGVAGCGSEGDRVANTNEPTWTGATAISDQQDHAFGVATDGMHVVFSTGGSQVGENAVRIVPLDGSAPSRIIVANPVGLIPSDSLVIDGDDVYVAAGPNILRVALAGGDVTVLVADRPADVTSLATDSTHVFWTTSALNRPDDAEVARAPKAGGAVEVIADPATGHGSFSSVVPDGHGGAFAGSPAGVVHAVPGADPTIVVTADEASGAVTRIAFDGTRLFGIVAGGRHDLFSVPASGGALTQLARNADSVKSVVQIAEGVAFFEGDALRYVAASGGTVTTIAAGPYSDGALAVFGDTLVFPADWRIWTATLPH